MNFCWYLICQKMFNSYIHWRTNGAKNSLNISLWNGTKARKCCWWAAGGEYFVSILANKALKQKNMRIKERLAMIKWWYHFHFIQWKNKRNPNSLTESANKWTKDWRVFKWELFMRLLSVFVDRWMFHEDSLPTMTSVGLRKIYCMAHNTNEKKYAVIIYVLTLNAPNQ